MKYAMVPLPVEMAEDPLMLASVWRREATDAGYVPTAEPEWEIVSDRFSGATALRIVGECETA